jgi:UDP-N-acetylglucosamine acyltransferase
VIHATAIIDPKAEVDPTVSVGPYAVIDARVKLGPHCIVGPHVYITGSACIGEHNQFFAGAVIGEAPQDLKYRGAPTSVCIGDHNVFREHVTVHRSTGVEAQTWIGSHNFLMANAHIGHNCRVGDHVIIANGALLGGYVEVHDRAFISGNCLVHQFIRVGTLALMQGGSAISKDLAPYTIARGDNGMCGLNVVGMRRTGMKPDERIELKKLYRLLFRSGKSLRAAAAQAQQEFSSEAAKAMLEFVAASRRGLCADNGKSVGSEEQSVD